MSEANYSGPRRRRTGAVLGSDRCRRPTAQAIPAPTADFIDDGSSNAPNEDVVIPAATSDSDELPSWDDAVHEERRDVGGSEPVGPSTAATQVESVGSGTVMWVKDALGRFTSRPSHPDEATDDGLDGVDVLMSGDSEEDVGKKKRRRKPRDDTWLLTETALGGPVIPNVIPSFGGHVAARIWTGPDRGVLTCYTRDKALTELSDWSVADETALGLVRGSGLSHLEHCMFKSLDIPLLSAFIERWQPDCNTFHMPFGEMTIMLHDVYHILGIQVDGLPCSAIPGSVDSKAKMCGLLRMGPDALLAPKKDKKRKAPYKGGGVLLESILERCRDDDSVDSCSRAQGYLLYLWGARSLPTRAGTVCVGLFRLSYFTRTMSRNTRGGREHWRSFIASWALRLGQKRRAFVVV